VTKIRYQIDLAAVPAITAPPGIRRVERRDLEALADLMLDAYVGTIDYEDEDYEDALSEVSGWLDDAPLLDHSYVLETAGRLDSAVLVCSVNDAPFIAYVMTRAEHKGRGWAKQLTAHALASLAMAGHAQVVFFITEGNVPSERLFRSLGAIATP
jgi:ribosomal protein S18 acetylase RimI-like enzyme